MASAQCEVIISRVRAPLTSRLYVLRLPLAIVPALSGGAESVEPVEAPSCTINSVVGRETYTES